MPIEINSKSNPLRMPWNKGRLVGQKRPPRPKEVWAIRVRLQFKRSKRDLAMFNLAIDSKLRGCDLVSLRVDDIAVGGHVRDRATIIQHETGRPVQFEIMEQTRASLQEWLNARPADRGPYVFPSRVHDQPHLTARQYARIVHGWIERAGMESSAYGTHSLRRTKAAQIYRKTGRPVQFEITEQTRASLQDWLNARPADRGPYVFPSRVHNQPHVTARQYARIVHGWIEGAGMDSSAYGTHSMRRTKPTLIYRRTKNLRAVQLLLGHTKLESTVRYLGIEVDDALEISEQTEI